MIGSGSRWTGVVDRLRYGLAGILGLPEAQSASFAFLYHAMNFLVIGVLGVIGILRTQATFGSVLASTRALVQSRAK